MSKKPRSTPKKVPQKKVPHFFESSDDESSPPPKPILKRSRAMTASQYFDLEAQGSENDSQGGESYDENDDDDMDSFICDEELDLAESDGMGPPPPDLHPCDDKDSHVVIYSDDGFPEAGPGSCSNASTLRSRRAGYEEKGDIPDGSQSDYFADEFPPTPPTLPRQVRRCASPPRKKRRIVPQVSKTSKPAKTKPVKKVGRPRNIAPEGSHGRHRGWVFTNNNYTPSDTALYRSFSRLVRSELQFFVAAPEVGESETPHYQGFVQFTNKKSWKQVCVFLNEPGYVAKAIADKCAADYCQKEGDEGTIMFGVAPISNKAARLKGSETNMLKWRAISDWAHSGQLDKINEANPQEYIHCYRTLTEIATKHAPPPPSLDGPCGYWLYGRAGAGKTHWANKKFPDAYQKPCTQWWPHYDKQETVLMNDIDPDNGKKLGGDIKIWADAYPYSGQIKGSNIMMRPKHFIVTSQYLPKQIWKDTKTLEAVHRRFHIMHFAEASWEEPNVRIKPSFDDPRVCSVEEPAAPLGINMFYAAVDK